jgi:hypothetical protein
MEFAPLIRQDFDLNKFQVMEMGGLAKLEESHEHWVVPISVAFAFNHDWELRQDLPAFKTAAVMAEIGGIR